MCRRREVIAGIAAGIAGGPSTANAEAAASPNQPNIRIIRNPDRHNEFGVGIEFVPAGQEKIMVAVYPRLFGDLRKLGNGSGPTGYRTSSKNESVRGVSELNRFDFPKVIFSDRAEYSLSFRIKTAANSVKIFAVLIANSPGSQPKTSKDIDLADFLQGKEGLPFDLEVDAAENFRWGIFGERLEIQGQGGRLTLRFARLAKPTGYSDWSEPELELVLEPIGQSKIRA
jgi:hypothetical protein